MRYSIATILIFYFSGLTIAQTGTVFTRNDNLRSTESYIEGIHNPFKTMDYTKYLLPENVSDGYYNKPYRDYEYNVSHMEGLVVNGKQEGEWKLYINEYKLFIGTYHKGLKQGVWEGYTIYDNEDSILYSQDYFKDDELLQKRIYKNSGASLEEVLNYKNGLLHGINIYYNTFNNIETRIKYNNGLIHGEYIQYNDNEDTITYIQYNNGVKHGICYSTTKGQKNEIAKYDNGSLEGNYIRYHDNGIVACNIIFKNNLPYNVLCLQDSTGNKLDPGTLTDGSGILNCYYENGNLKSSFTYSNQIVAGRFICYNKSGNIDEEGDIYMQKKRYNENRSNNLNQPYYYNFYSVHQQNLTEKTNYTIYETDGNIMYRLYTIYPDTIDTYLIQIEQYKDGILIMKRTDWDNLIYGNFSKFYDSGILEKSGSYNIIESDSVLISVQEGIFNYYHTNGKLMAQIPFHQGEVLGKSVYYTDEGQLLYTEIVEPDGTSFGIYDNDTVNRKDKLGRKQGKWVNISFSLIKYGPIHPQIKIYKDDEHIITLLKDKRAKQSGNEK